MPDSSVPGLHHVTALSGAAQDTLDFYAGVLGLRLVKRTVNFDDPMTHHLYYGDTVGQPGTILTFFPWPQAAKGQSGAGMVTTVAFAVPPGTIEAWANRLDAAGVEGTTAERFGETVLQFEDPSGLSLELIATDEVQNASAWTTEELPAEQALQSLYAPTLPVFTGDQTPALFTEIFGWARIGDDEDRVRFRAPEGGLTSVVDLQVRDRHPSGRMGRGAVHHVAFRARNAEEQKAWQAALRERDIQVTDVKDRQYFQSIYFRDPDWTSGILFEIATDPPGFLVDETEKTLGRTLQLPPWLKERRDELEAALPELTSPSTAAG